MSIQSRNDLGSLIPNDASVCEVGVAEGNNSIYMLDNWSIKLLICVDSWRRLDQKGDGAEGNNWHIENFNKFFKRAAKHANRVWIMPGLSVEMSRLIQDESLDLLYLDGDHNYEGVMADLHAWVPKVKKGGIVAGHDYLNLEDYGVNKAVSEFCLKFRFTPITIPENNEKDASFYFRKQYEN